MLLRACFKSRSRREEAHFSVGAARRIARNSESRHLDSYGKVGLFKHALRGVSLSQSPPLLPHPFTINKIAYQYCNPLDEFRLVGRDRRLPEGHIVDERGGKIDGDHDKTHEACQTRS